MTFRSKTMTLSKSNEELRDNLEQMNKIQQRIEEIDIKEFHNDIPEQVDNSDRSKKELKSNDSEEDTYIPWLRCKLCEMTFDKSSDLENHIKSKHEEFNYEHCNKTFVSLWRLRKHKQIHVDKSRKHCHYFNQGVKCPFDNLGCKFLHVLSVQCKFDPSCKIKLCSYRHQTKSVRNRSIKENNIENAAGNLNGISVDADDIRDETKEITAFCSSTPKDYSSRCQERFNSSECADCIVKQMFRRHSSLRADYN